jgi:tetratricopeptide (TPR) repeat protein
MRFENQTRSDELAWVGDAVGDRFAAGLDASGVALLDPEAVAWLDADLVVWTPSGVLNHSLARAVNVVADRAGVEQVVAGRVLQDPGGPLACVAVFAPRGRAATSTEHCEPVDIGRPYEAAERLADVVRPVLGGGAERSPSMDVPGDVVRRYVEGRQSIRRQMWGRAVRQLERATRDDAGFVDARRLGARISSRWQPRAPEVLRSLSGADTPRGAIEALKAKVARDSTSVEARMDLGRLLIDLELFGDAVSVLNPLRYRPGTPAEAFGWLATAMSSLGEMGRGYQVLLEGRRRSWQEPTGNSLLGEHLTRWGFFGLATTYFNDARDERSRQGMAPLTVDELLARWSMHALQRDWVECQKLATTLTTLDDPRAKGLGNSRLALGYLAAGRSRTAGVLAEDAAREFAEERVDTAEALSTAVQVRIEANDDAGALRIIEGLRPSAVGALRERAAFWEAFALARLGRWAQAEAVRDRLERDLTGLPGPTGRRLLLHLDGELAILRGDAMSAVASLSKAVELLPARGFCGDHLPLWYALGRAHLAARADDLARPWLEGITTASYERLCWPIPYVRSHFLLGRIHASSGRPDQAADAYRRFLDLWGEADNAAAERLAAQRFLAAWQKERQAASGTGTEIGSGG